MTQNGLAPPAMTPQPNPSQGMPDPSPMGMPQQDPIAAMMQQFRQMQGMYGAQKQGAGGMGATLQALMGAGRNGDTMLAHIRPDEARRADSINPVTQLPEFYDGGEGGSGPGSQGGDGTGGGRDAGGGMLGGGDNAAGGGGETAGDRAALSAALAALGSPEVGAPGFSIGHGKSTAISAAELEGKNPLGPVDQNLAPNDITPNAFGMTTGDMVGKLAGGLLGLFGGPVGMIGGYAAGKGIAAGMNAPAQASLSSVDGSPSTAGGAPGGGSPGGGGAVDGGRDSGGEGGSMLDGGGMMPAPPITPAAPAPDNTPMISDILAKLFGGTKAPTSTGYTPFGGYGGGPQTSLAMLRAMQPPGTGTLPSIMR